MVRELLAVAIGGASGSMMRYLLAYVMLTGYTVFGFPVGTFTVNAAGSLLIGIVLEATDSATAGWLLAVGFCGGFTTFSSFSADAIRLLKAGDYSAALLYIGLSVIVCLACVMLGMWIGQLLKN